MPDSTVPDVQLLLAGAPLTAHPYLKPFRQPYQDAFGGRVVMLHPESRGEVVLGSADPGAPIRIRQNFMSTEREWKTLRAGMRLMHDVMRQSQMAPFVARELNPVFGSDAALDEHIRNTAITLHHPLGTCKMGRETDEDGGGRSASAGARRRAAARGRRLGDAGPDQRQHQRAGDDDRREGRRHDPRQADAGAAERLATGIVAMSRMPPLDHDAMSPEQKRVYDQIAGKRKTVRGPFPMWLRNPKLAEHANQFGVALRDH